MYSEKVSKTDSSRSSISSGFLMTWIPIPLWPFEGLAIIGNVSFSNASFLE